jgi:AraC-like DNA-binding protein
VRHLLRARDLADARYFERVEDMARGGVVACSLQQRVSESVSESPHAYLLTRRLGRAAALLRTTDRSVAEICAAVGLRSVGSFTTIFKRAHGLTPLGVEFVEPPEGRPYGIDSAFRDPSGNFLRLMQLREAPPA